MSSLQAGVGLYSLAALYAAFLISSLFVPPFLLAKLKSKWTLLFAVTGYIVYLSAQFYPKFATLIPAAIYLGTCGAPLWTAQAAYLTCVSAVTAMSVVSRFEIILSITKFTYKQLDC